MKIRLNVYDHGVVVLSSFISKSSKMEKSLSYTGLNSDKIVFSES